MPLTPEELDEVGTSLATQWRCISGKGEMADRIRSLNWSETALGRMDRWSEALLVTVNMMLSSPLPMQLLWGPEFTILYNDNMIDSMADKHPGALGQPGRQVWSEAWATVGPQLEAVLTQGESMSFREISIPLLRNGSVTETFWDYSYSPVYGSSGSILGVLDIARDVTTAVVTRKQQEELRTRGELLAEELDQVFTATSDAIVSVDRNWRMTYFNAKAEELYGPSSKYDKLTLWEAFPETQFVGSPYVKHLEAAMYEGIAGHFEAYYPAPLDFWMALNVYPTRNGIVLFGRNVSAVRKAQEAVLQTEKLAAVGRLAASMAHEINNPLESVTNLLYLIQGSEEIADARTYANTAESELRRVSLIANQTLRFHKQSTNPVPAFCYDLIGDSLAIFKSRLANNNIQVEKRKRAEHPVECLDAEIRQVLNSLLGNAIDAMPLGGRLILRSREQMNYRKGKRGLVITVADTGTGMPAEVQKRAFEAFYTTKGIGGTGLGLWISCEIVARHGGALRLRSSMQPGRTGTVFNLFLPFQEQNAIADYGNL